MFKKSIIEFALYTIICGALYPFTIYTLSDTFLKYQTNGSLLHKENIIIGSSLIGQNFSDPKYFWGRPSSTSPDNYNALASSGSNLALSNPILKSAYQERINSLAPTDGKRIPIELISSSASGLDPEISLAAAKIQVNRIAKARQIADQTILDLINKRKIGKQLGFLGTARINVLLLNIELDKISSL